jgi:hypothetical protein
MSTEFYRRHSKRAVIVNNAPRSMSSSGSALRLRFAAIRKLFNQAMRAAFAAQMTFWSYEFMRSGRKAIAEHRETTNGFRQEGHGRPRRPKRSITKLERV